MFEEEDDDNHPHDTATSSSMFVHVPTSAAKASTGISTPLFNFTMGMPTAPRVRVISTATHMAMECIQTIHREGIVLQGDLQENL